MPVSPLSPCNEVRQAGILPDSRQQCVAVLFIRKGTLAPLAKHSAILSINQDFRTSQSNLSNSLAGALLDCCHLSVCSTGCYPLSHPHIGKTSGEQGHTKTLEPVVGGNTLQVSATTKEVSELIFIIAFIFH